MQVYVMCPKVMEPRRVYMGVCYGCVLWVCVCVCVKFGTEVKANHVDYRADQYESQQ